MKQPNVYVFCLCIYIQLLQLHQCFADKCNRIAFDNLLSEDNDNLLSSVYIRTSPNNNGYSVFEDEKGRGNYFTAGNSRFWYFSKRSIDHRVGFTGLFSETLVNMEDLNTVGSTRITLQYCPEEQRYKHGAFCLKAIQRGTVTIRCVPGMTECGDKQIAYIHGKTRIIFTKNKTIGTVYNNPDYTLHYNILESKWILKSVKRDVVINSVFSASRKPEYITTKWNHHIRAGRLIECVGKFKRKCTSFFCQNSGILEELGVHVNKDIMEDIANSNKKT